MKRGGLALRNLGDLAEHLRRTRLVVAHRSPATLDMIANRLQQAQRPDTDHVGGVLGLIERNPYV